MRILMKQRNSEHEMLPVRLFLILTLVVVITNLPQSSGYRILGIFPLNGRSHMMMFEQLMKGLAARGHQVDVVSTFPLKNPYPNYTDIVIPQALQQFVNNLTYAQFQDITKKSLVHFVALTPGNHLCEKGMTFPAIQKLINDPPRDPPYDLVITEVFSAHCFMAFGRHLKVPVVGLSSAALYPWTHDFVANPENLAFVPNNLLEHMDNMNFMNRLYNVVHNFYIKICFNHLTSSQSELVKSHFNSDALDIRELERELALILVNSHFSMNGVKPTTPAIVEVGGLHVQDDDSKIPADHKKWLDDSKNGFIYFTFGSMVTIESFPELILQSIYKSFQRIDPVRILMKAPRPELLPPGLPKNVRTFTWIPQLKVLKHPNIRAFITHGGLMSTQEAISYAVPMIGMPLFADQFLNIDLYVKKKIAVRVDYHDITAEKLDAALNEVLHNPIYRKMAKEVSHKFLDRPLSAMDEACYWIEYVIRNGNLALRSPALDFSWWQISLLDVYLTLIIASVIAISVIILLFQRIINIIFGNPSVIPHSKKYD
nr:UDP-glucosyltransferase 334AA4 [Meteorus pulchricornis]